MKNKWKNKTKKLNLSDNRLKYKYLKKYVGNHLEFHIIHTAIYSVNLVKLKIMIKKNTWFFVSSFITWGIIAQKILVIKEYCVESTLVSNVQYRFSCHHNLVPTRLPTKETTQISGNSYLVPQIIWHTITIKVILFNSTSPVNKLWEKEYFAFIKSPTMEVFISFFEHCCN